MRADMRVLFAALLWLLPAVALAQYPSPTVQNFTVLGTTTANGVSSLTGGVAFGNTATSTGTLSGAGMSLNLDSGAASFGTVGAISLNLSGALASAGTVRNVAGVSFNLTTGQSAANDWFGSFVYASGSVTNYTDVNGFYINDNASVTNGNIQGLDILDNIAPNGNSASGPRTALNVNYNEVGTSQGGTYTNPGISSAVVASASTSTNAGGTSSLYQGGLNGLTPYCVMHSGATYREGCSGIEIDMAAESGSSYDGSVGLLIVQLSTNAVEPRLGDDAAINIGDQAGATVGWTNGLLFGSKTGEWSIDPAKGKLIYATQSVNAGFGSPGAASGVDLSAVKMAAFATQYPFSEDAPLQAQSITSATRLTSDGNAASSFVYDAFVSSVGSGYTSNPTVTVTGCTGAQVNASIGAGGVLSQAGVYSPGSACSSAATAAVSGGGGTGATVALKIAGNTLNFPINSAIEVHCQVVAQNSGGTEQLGEHIYFGAKQGSTPGTTAILGSPSWVSDFSVGTPTITFGTPAADTTWGAINITVTPSGGTWNVGGSCHMVGTQQVL